MIHLRPVILLIINSPVAPRRPVSYTPEVRNTQQTKPLQSKDVSGLDPPQTYG